VGRVLYVASYDRNVYALDAGSGQELWRVPIDGQVVYGPSVANGIVYASTDAGTLFAIGGTESAAAAGLTGTPITPASATPAAAASPVAAARFPGEFVWRTTGGPVPLTETNVLAVAPDGNLWVMDGRHNQFQIFTPDGTYLETWGTSGKAEGQFNFTRVDGGAVGGIAFSPDGGFYVTDARNYRMQPVDAQ